MSDEYEEFKLAFLGEASQLLTDAEQCFLRLEKGGPQQEILEELFRVAHNIKGSAKAVGLEELSAFTHKLESLLLKVKNREIAITDPITSLLLRVNDQMVVMVDGLKVNLEARFDVRALADELEATTRGEANTGGAPAAAAPQAPLPSPSSFPPEALAAAAPQAPVAEAAPAPAEAAGAPPAPPAHDGGPAAPAGGGGGGGNQAKIDEGIRVSLSRLEKLMNMVGELTILESVFGQHAERLENDAFIKDIAEFKKICREIQHMSMSLRMVPVKQTFQKMQRIVRDTARALNKDVRFDMQGEDTELDRTILDKIGDPLVHLVRNAVDHGLESTADREKNGKPRQGVVRLSAFHRGGQIVIEVQDDGNGLDAKKLTNKAIEKKILKPGTVLSDQEAYQLIFAAGFSTKTEVTDISGRGVGMDVVRTNISALQGEIQVETQLGKGSTFRISLPLTLAIVDAFLVRLHGERYVVPITQVSETVRIQPGMVNRVAGAGAVFELRGEPLPVMNLEKLLKRADGKAQEQEEFHALIIRAGKGMHYSLLVDEILGQQQVVIKSLGADLAGMRGVSGSTILGDGQPALILDLAELLENNRTARGLKASA